ncbi:KAP family P-loop domain protein [Leptospira santarosai str. 2000027870]|uniref:P-loop NTPase fold protein n=1 Tax=Leptospira santarosai TaxID=28183 RepID=UPI0002BF3B00|nr:P-loop NTPase fold protein [Leptospira santarosai]EMM86445.1 KAP family P-loop domain protein [Leptospira santarosai str. 2000027870]
MKHISKIITNFVDIEKPEFALLINGKWGSGKTYFIKTEIAKNIINKKAIYISLNGLSGIDTISTRLLISYFSISETVNMGHDIVKTLMDMAESVPYVKIGSKILKGMASLANRIFSEKIDFTNSLIIFDDLERISPNLNIIDVLGYINTNFIEHHNYSVILLCDENKISTKEGYQAAKEKVIGRTLEFQQSVEGFIDEYMLTRYSASPEYLYFLQTSREMILMLLLRAEEENIRTYNFIFDSFKNIFHIVYETELSEYLPSLLQLFISISIEFKRGLLVSADSKEFKDLENLEQSVTALMSQRSVLKLIKNEMPQKESPYYEIFYGKYIEHSEIPWVFSKEIYTYILAGYYDQVKLLEELKRDHEKKEKEWNVQLRKLYDFRGLEIDELRGTLLLINEFINTEKYKIAQLPNILHIISNINSIGFLEFDYEQIKNKIEILIQEHLEKIKATDSDEVEMFRPKYYIDSKDSAVKSAIEKMKEIESVTREKNLTNTLKQFYVQLDDNHFYEFSKTYSSLRHEGLFGLLNKYGYASKITKLKNRGIQRFSNILDEMFLQINNAGSVYYNEKNALLDMVKEIKQSSKTESIDQMKEHLLNELIEQLVRAANHLEATK